MPLTMTVDERAAVQAAQAHRRAVRHWRRYQAVLLRADGVPIATIAQTLDCTETSVYNWIAAWRVDGLVGVAEGVHPGKVRRLDAAAEAALEALLTEGDPQAYGYMATGWTVPLLRTELTKRGWQAAERTIPSGCGLPPKPRISNSPSYPSARPNSCPARICGGSPRRWWPPTAPTPRSRSRPNAPSPGSPP